MDKSGKTGRRYSAEEDATVVRMARTLGASLGIERATAQRVALQLGYAESVRSWVRQVDVYDGLIGGVMSDGSDEIRRLEQENR